jgi:hypothetical protein
MINPKYDPNNYLKHLAIAVITDNQKINQLFGSYLLMIKWWAINTEKILPKPDLIGRLRIHLSTPFGELEPQEYSLRVSDHKRVYVQFLTIPQPDYQYRIEVIHPVGIARSMLEVWEYVDPYTPTPIIATSINLPGINSSNQNPHHHVHNNISIGYPEQGSSGQQNAVDLITTVVPPSTATSTAFVMLAANTIRAAGSRIDNATNRDFYVSFNTTQVPTPGQPFNLLPKSATVGGTIQPGFLDVPQGYLGAILGIAASGSAPITGNIYVHEMVAQ